MCHTEVKPDATILSDRVKSSWRLGDRKSELEKEKEESCDRSVRHEEVSHLDFFSVMQESFCQCPQISQLQVNHLSV